MPGQDMAWGGVVVHCQLRAPRSTVYSSAQFVSYFCMFSPCSCGFLPGSTVSSQSVDGLAMQYCPYVNVCERGVLPPNTQCFQDRHQIHHNKKLKWLMKMNEFRTLTILPKKANDQKYSCNKREISYENKRKRVKFI